MLQEQLKRIYSLVGEITTEFNNVEMLWYLIFTALLHPALRPAIYAVFDQHKTGGGQRKLISDIAAALKTTLERQPSLADLEKMQIEIFTPIIALCKTTDRISSRRNRVIHTLFYIADFTKPPTILAAGISKRSGLADKQIETELNDILAAIEYHSLDVAELRLRVIAWIYPNMDVERDRRHLESLRREVANKHSRRP